MQQLSKFSGLLINPFEKNSLLQLNYIYENRKTYMYKHISSFTTTHIDLQPPQPGEILYINLQNPPKIEKDS